jgi:DNA processing protein
MIEGSLTFAERFVVSAPVQSDYAPWIALTRVKGLGCVTFKKLAAHFADPTVAFSSTGSELSAIEGLDASVIEELLGFAQWEEVNQEIRRVEQAGATLIPFTAAAYPSRLRMIADPPPVLYAKGRLCAEDNKAVAVVGSRSASEYGRRVARNLCRELASLGFTVISGMARGLDGVAHEATLSAGGRTIAVLGSGVDRPYPPEHDKLYHRISESGAVLSEFPMGTGPLAFNFPARNRLISGLSLGVVVVEATEKSGSLITAALALEQGREVFAVPGEVGASRSRGTHRLIRQGAKLVETAADIIEEIAPQLLNRARVGATGAQRALPQQARAEARRVLALLQERSAQIDEVIERSGLSPAEVSEVLLDLELQGYVRQLAGKRYTAE